MSQKVDAHLLKAQVHGRGCPERHLDRHVCLVYTVDFGSRSSDGISLHTLESTH